jgi:hypothetical protein
MQVTKLLLGKVALLLVAGIGWMLTLALKNVLQSVVEMHARHDFLLLASVTEGLAFIGTLASPIPALRRFCRACSSTANRIQLTRWLANCER